MTLFTRREIAGAAIGLSAAAAFATDAATGAVASEPSPFTTRGPAPSTTVATHTRKVLAAEAPTPETFAPFGQLLTPDGRKRLPINTYGSALDLYREGFETDQPIEWFIFEGRPRGTEVLFLERHRQLGQTFIPVNGRPYVMIVAPPGAPEADGFPLLDQLRAFLVPGHVPVQLHRSTWHENPMPLEDGTRMLVTSHANLTVAHQQNPDPALASLPLDLERRWYRAGGYDIRTTAG